MNKEEKYENIFPYKKGKNFRKKFDWEKIEKNNLTTVLNAL